MCGETGFRGEKMITLTHSGQGRCQNPVAFRFKEMGEFLPAPTAVHRPMNEEKGCHSILLLPPVPNRGRNRSSPCNREQSVPASCFIAYNHHFHLHHTLLLRSHVSMYRRRIAPLSRKIPISIIGERGNIISAFLRAEIV